MSEETRKPGSQRISATERARVLGRLLDHHSFLYEAQKDVYGTFTQIPVEDARDKIKKLWDWIEVLFNVPRGGTVPIKRCSMILVNKGERGERYSLTNESIVAESFGQDAQARKAQGWQAARRLLGFQDDNWDAIYSHPVISGYYLHRTATRAEELLNVDDVLTIPAALVTKGLTKENDLLTILNPEPEPRYYQRILFLFSCDSPEAARRVKAYMRPLLTSFIGNWGQQLLMKLGKYEGAAEAEKAIRQQQSHAMGTELSYIRALMGFAVADVMRRCEEMKQIGSLRQHMPNLLEASKALAHSTNFQREAFDGAADRFFSDLSTRLRFHVFPPRERRFIRAIGSLLVDFGTSAIEIDMKEFFPLAEDLDDATTLQRALDDLVLTQNKIKEVRDHNRALLRLGEPEMELRVKLADKETSETAPDRILENRLKRALEIVIFNLFERGLPSSKIAGEDTYSRALENLFGKAEPFARKWKDFYRTNRYGEGFSYPELRQWLLNELVPDSKLSLTLPEMQNFGWTAGSDTGLVTLEVWLKEALLNAFKYARPPREGMRTEISVAWSFHDLPELSVSNTVDHEIVVSGKAGRYGSQFLETAAKYLFMSGRLYRFHHYRRFTLRVATREEMNEHQSSP